MLLLYCMIRRSIFSFLLRRTKTASLLLQNRLKNELSMSRYSWSLNSGRGRGRVPPHQLATTSWQSPEVLTVLRQYLLVTNPPIAAKKPQCSPFGNTIFPNPWKSTKSHRYHCRRRQRSETSTNLVEAADTAGIKIYNIGIRRSVIEMFKDIVPRKWEYREICATVGCMSETNLMTKEEMSFVV